MTRYLRKHPFLVSYVMLFIAAVGGFTDQRFQNERIAASNRRICMLTLNSWNERNALVLQFTEPSVLSPALRADLQSTSVHDLQAQIDHANAVKAANRVLLLGLQGPKPTC